MLDNRLFIFLVLSLVLIFHIKKEGFTPYSWRKYYPWGGYRTYWHSYEKHNYPYRALPSWKRLIYPELICGSKV